MKIDDAASVVKAGDIMPAGGCPKCYWCAYIVRSPGELKPEYAFFHVRARYEGFESGSSELRISTSDPIMQGDEVSTKGFGSFEVWAHVLDSKGHACEPYSMVELPVSTNIESALAICDAIAGAFSATVAEGSPRPGGLL